MAIKIRTIIEMLGKPKEHIETTLANYVKKLHKDGIKITKETFAPAKENGELFSTFCELEIDFEDMQEIQDFCLNNMPSSVEVIAPDEITMPASEATSLFTDLAGHIHQVDMALKERNAKLEILDRNAVALLRNFILHHISTGPKQIGELAKVLGIRDKELAAFLDRMIEMNLIVKEGDSYTLAKKQ